MNEPKNKRKVVKELLKNRAYVKGHFCVDVLMYIINHHSLFSILTVHKDHPYSRIDRIIVLICYLMSSAFFGSITSAQKLDEQWVCMEDYQLTNETSIYHQCVNSTIYKSYILCVEYGIVVWVWTSILRLLATCACAQTSKNNLLKETGTVCGNCGLILGFLSSIPFLVFAIKIPVDKQMNMTQWCIEFIIAQSMSWALDIIIFFFIASFSWCCERKGENKKKKKNRQVEIEEIENKESVV